MTPPAAGYTVTSTGHPCLQVDHYNVGEGRTFQQRYLISAEYWGGRGKPIFLYTGNEGDITWFCNNTVSQRWDHCPHVEQRVNEGSPGTCIPRSPASFWSPSIHAGVSSRCRSWAPITGDGDDIITELALLKLDSLQGQKEILRLTTCPSTEHQGL